MKNKIYGLVYVLLLIIYSGTLIFLPNENYLNIIFSMVLVFSMILLLYYKKINFRIFFITNIIFIIYIFSYNFINIPGKIKNYKETEFNYISQNIEDNDDENIIKIKNILNNKLDLNSFYDVLGIISKNKDLDYSTVDFDKNQLFEKLINDVLFDENNGNLIYGKTLFYSKNGFENYKKYFKNYLILKYLNNEDIVENIFSSNDNLFYIFLNKRFLYNSHINEDVFNINYQNLVKIEEVLK